MILYHGSSKVVETPAFGLGSTTNDYGQGFYCTENPELSKEWACPTINNGFSNKYELDLTGLNVLYLNNGEYNILNWIAILLKNRTFQKRSPISREASKYIMAEFMPNISDYDVIIGYRADDSYFGYAKDFLNNTISVSQLGRAMKLGNLGEQVVLMSKKAFKNISFIEYEIADGSIYNPRRMAREERARRAYLNNHGTDFKTTANDLFVMDIIREQVKNNDKRLQ